MRPIPSVSRKLVLSVALPLVLFFGLTILVLDGLFRNLTTQAQRDLLEQQLVALVSAADPGNEGSVTVRLLDPDSSFATPGSGRYARVSGPDGQLLWSSPSLAGVELDFGGPVAAGERRLFERPLADSTQVAVLSRGLLWEYSTGNAIHLTFSVADSTQPYRQLLWRFRQTVVGWFTLMTLLLLGVLGWLLRRALEPVRRLEREIHEVERGEREILGGAYPRELAGVAGNLNTLLVSERRRIVRYRDTLGNLAHGLKTPLAVIRTALTHDADPRAGINREIDRMVQIVDHQLQRAATGGGATLGQAPIPVRPIIADLRAAMLRVHGSKDLEIELRIEPTAGFLGDRGDLTELLGNLLDNACKWARARVLVSAFIDAAATPPQLVIRVEDDGAGIAPADRERVLSRGVRVDERSPGHGLGLAMVSDTVALYGGELTLGTAATLGGARFEVRLPGRAVTRLD